MRTLCPLAAAVGVWVGGSGQAKEPAKTAPATPPATATTGAVANQRLADAVASKLRQSGAMTGADVGIVAVDGKVELNGFTRDDAQKAAILREVSAVPGVTAVRGTFSTAAGNGVTAVQATDRMAGAAAIQTAQAVEPAPGGGGPVMLMHGGHGGPYVEPAPLGAPGVVSPDMQAPPLPPHAWPTYAPYNNVSRVAYPQAYPYNAFPFIGPYYPFPKVPLGWRKVVLEWEDGYWYLGKASTPHDYWRVRFW